MSMANSSEKTKFFWKGKRVTENVLKRRIKQSNLAKRMNSVKSCNSHNLKKKEKTNNKGFQKIKITPPLHQNVSNIQVNKSMQTISKTTDANVEVEGRRIIHIGTLAQELFCRECKQILSLTDIVKEKRFGIASIFYVRCRSCSAITGATTDKKHETRTRAHFDGNTKIAFGTLNGGLGRANVNKVLSVLNIPALNHRTYQSHENEVGKSIEELAKESCLAAAREERRLTIDNAEKLLNLLPPHLDIQFIFPDASLLQIKEKKITENMRVRIAASYDMGWPTRGTGRAYDSLSGTGHIIGLNTGKVIGFVTLNRKCAKCDAGHPITDHDCRLNFVGSAKAMEPHAAVLLTKDNIILQACNIEVGIVIADNDSSAICAIRQASNHEVAKQSDKNHTTKGVANELYKIQKKHKELNSVSITFLKKCFSYCVSQNIGNCEAMAKAISNIPEHCFNRHENCGSWCHYREDPDNYTHSVIGNGFSDESLYTSLKNIFYELAAKSGQFVAGASSNPNENLNHIIASVAPKSKFFGKSSSGDIRVALGVNRKNVGELFSKDLLDKKLMLSPGKYTIGYSEKLDNYRAKRYAKSITKTQKNKRLFLKKAKTQLRNKIEAQEGRTYESNVGLLDNVLETLKIPVVRETEYPVSIYFDLETGGFLTSADILQIAAACENFQFSVYINPTKKISEESSQVHGLKLADGRLYLHNEIVETVSLLEAIVALLEFISIFKQKCILIAHNCSFDYSRLMESIEKFFLKEHFKSVVVGFCDTLPLIKKVTEKKGKGDNKLENLANKLEISSEGAHNAIKDVVMLEMVVRKLDISNEMLKENTFSWCEAENRLNFKKNLPSAMKSLDLLKDCTSYAMRKKIIAADISYNMIEETYITKKDVGLAELFGKYENNSIRVTKNKRVLKKICEFLESQATSSKK